MSEVKGSKAFQEVKNAKYESPYSRIIANSLQTFHSVTRVSNKNFTSSIGAALTSSVQQTIEAMAISDEHFVKLETVLKKKRATTSNILDKHQEVDTILKEALGENIVTKEQVTKLIDEVSNKFENFQKVENKLKASNLIGYNKQLDDYRLKNNEVVKASIEEGKGKRLLFEKSFSYRVNELTKEIHGGFISLVGYAGNNNKYATQGTAFIATVSGFLTARFVKDVK